MKRTMTITGLVAVMTLVALTAILAVPTLAARTAPAAASVSAYNWLQFNGDSAHSGNNSAEAIITAGNVSNLKLLYQVNLLGTADGAPVYLSSVATAGGTRPVVYVTAKDGHIQALDALTGASIWNHQNGPGSCKINNGGSPCYTTSSPAIDPGLSFVYSYGLDGFVHKYQVGNGSEVTTAPWPEQTTLKPFNEKGSPALDTVTTGGGTSYLYMANGGYPGDAGDYQGHITAINLSDGSQKVFNAVCSNQVVHFAQTPATPDCPSVQTAIWSRAAVVYSAATGKIYMATGNGDYNPSLNYWGDSVFALNPDGTGASGKPLDTFTPADFASLQASDADLGSTAPAILPSITGSNVAHLAVQGGKDSKLRLLNLDNLSGHSATGFTGGEIGTIINVPQGSEVLTAPAVWSNPADGSVWVFVGTGSGTGGGMAGIKVSAAANGTPQMTPIWHNTTGGTSPIVADGVLFYASSGAIHALNPVNGNSLWSSSLIGGIHWESPIVADGVLYITDESGQLTAYSLFGIAPPQIKYNYISLIKK
jgi:outer membrane protein assembly factor BamB